ncbi:MAG: DUF72 domain-containing protein [Gammaproteobacteria bacterium]
MSTPIYIGTYGWDDPAWAARFYPDELPADWRFCFYSNRLRSVIVPGATGAEADARTLAQWVEDSDPEFGFVVELPPALARPVPAPAPQIAAFIERLAPLAAQVRGMLVPLDNAHGIDSAWLAQLVSALEPFPVCVDPASSWRCADVRDVLVRHRVGECWYPARDPEPVPGGRLLVVRTEAATPREQRRILEQTHAWQGDHGLAGVFFDGREAPTRAEQARVVAELMGI